MKLQQVKVLFAKTLSQFCMVLFLVLFAAAAEGALSIPAALALGFLNLVSLNALCGLLLAKPAAQPAVQKVPAQVVYPLRRRTAAVPLRLAHSGEVA